MYIKKLTFLALATLLPFITDASVYLKGFAGRVNNNQELQSYQYASNPTLGFTDFTDYKRPSKITQLTGGIGAGIIFDNFFLTEMYSNLKAGLELDVSDYSGKYRTSTFTSDSFLTNSFIDNQNTLVYVDNKYKVDIWGLLYFMDLFYIKTGASYLNQNISTTVFGSNIPRITNNVSISDNNDIWGISFGSGLKLKLSKNLSVFSEFSNSFFRKQKLSDLSFSGNNDQSPGANTDAVATNYNRKIRFSSTTFVSGILLSTDTLI